MRLSHFSQIELRDVDPEVLDLMVVACGYEERATYVAERFGTAPSRRVQLRFSEHADHECRRQNDITFAALGYRAVDCSGDDPRKAGDAVVAELATLDPDKPTRVGVDISSMTRAWSWGITKRIADLGRSSPVEILYFYSAAEFAPPATRSAPPRSLGPIPGLGGSLELPDRDIALLIGLGYETDRALGVVEYVEPRVTWLFYADPAVDPKFISEVRRANSALLQRVGSDNVIPYRLHDLGHTLAMLDSLVARLVVGSRVIIAPLGPKPFALLAFLLGLRYPEVDVWRVSGGAGSEPQRRKPTGMVLVAKTIFEAVDGEAASAIARR